MRSDYKSDRTRCITCTSYQSKFPKSSNFSGIWHYDKSRCVLETLCSYVLSGYSVTRSSHFTMLHITTRVEQLELLRSLVEIVAERDAISPFLDLNNLLSLGNAQAGLALRSLNRRFPPISSIF